MRVDGLAGPTGTDTGHNEALFPIWQIIGHANDTSVAVSATLRGIHIDEPSNGQRIKTSPRDATGSPQPQLAA